MKYIILLICVLMLAGCGLEVQDGQEVPDVISTIRTFEFRNHNYIGFFGPQRLGIVHDPDCKYCLMKNIKGAK